MSEEKLVRTMVTVQCPHCSQLSVVCIRTSAPSVDWNIKEESLKESKKKVIDGLEMIEFSDPDRKKEILDMISSENVFIGPDEVDGFLKGVYLENQIK